MKISAKPDPRTSLRTKYIIGRKIDYETEKEDLPHIEQNTILTSTVFPSRLILLLYTDPKPLTLRKPAALSQSKYLLSNREAYIALGSKN